MHVQVPHQIDPADICHAADLIDSQVYAESVIPQPAAKAIVLHAGAAIEVEPEETEHGQIAVRAWVLVEGLDRLGNINQLVSARLPLDASADTIAEAKRELVTRAKYIADAYRLAREAFESGKPLDGERVHVWLAPESTPDNPDHTDVRCTDEHPDGTPYLANRGR